MMGLSLLTKIIDLDGGNNHKWIKYLNDTGYIKCLVNSFVNTDNQLLEESFHAQAKNEKALYIFESKIGLFVAISGTQFGADCLLKNGLITALSSCNVFNLRVRFDRYAHFVAVIYTRISIINEFFLIRNIYGTRNATYLIQLLNQFYQIFFPVMNLFISIVNTMGPNNIEAKSHVIHLTFLLRSDRLVV